MISAGDTRSYQSFNSQRFPMMLVWSRRSFGVCEGFLEYGVGIVWGVGVGQGHRRLLFGHFLPMFACFYPTWHRELVCWLPLLSGDKIQVHEKANDKTLTLLVCHFLLVSTTNLKGKAKTLYPPTWNFFHSLDNTPISSPLGTTAPFESDNGVNSPKSYLLGHLKKGQYQLHCEWVCVWVKIHLMKVVLASGWVHAELSKAVTPCHDTHLPQ